MDWISLGPDFPPVVVSGGGELLAYFYGNRPGSARISISNTIIVGTFGDAISWYQYIPDTGFKFRYLAIYQSLGLY